VTLDEGLDFTPAVSLDVLALHESLERLTRLSPRQSEIVQLRFFGGLTGREIAHVLGISERTVKERWRVAKAWLLRELSR
jgi:RNA polymerase sigma factor (sigma-70 family)